MELSELRQFADEGLSSADPLAELSAGCADLCSATGDARYCILAETFLEIDRWWDEQGVPAALFEQLSELIKNQLPQVLDEDSPALAAQAAARLRDEARTRLVGSRDW